MLCAHQQTTAALPWQTIVILIVLWALVTLPLTIAGGIVGSTLGGCCGITHTWQHMPLHPENHRSEFWAPVRTSKYEREIPALPIYRSTTVQMLMAGASRCRCQLVTTTPVTTTQCLSGFLPFSAIYVELYYVLVSAWGHKLYHPPFSILFIMFAILILVTAFVTVALTYFQLAAEDHRWWWRSFLCGGSTGIFLYAYCAFFFIYRSEMRGFYQVWCLAFSAV